MKICLFSSRKYDQRFFDLGNTRHHFDIQYYDFQLNSQTASLANGFEVVCAFVNDDLSKPVLHILAKGGIKLIAMRCAGYNNVDLNEAKSLGIQVVRVPAYSPEAVAEHAIALMMTLNRRTHKAYQRTRDANFSLDGLEGFNMYGRTAGIIGTGRIGIATLRILKGFGCQLLAHDPFINQDAVDLGVEYVDLNTLFEKSDIISLHCPLLDSNYHLLDAKAFEKMKDGVMVINTSRGGLLDSEAAINALKKGRIGALGLDVYENERNLFFEDYSNEVITDDIYRRLSACHNVIFTGHQAFLTDEALTNISDTTLSNIQAFNDDKLSGNELVKLSSS